MANYTFAFVVPAVLYLLTTLCGLAMWLYSSIRTRLPFAYVYVFTWAVGSVLFTIHLVLTLDPRITFALLGPHGPEVWLYMYTYVQMANVIVTLVALAMLIKWIHRQVERPDA